MRRHSAKGLQMFRELMKFSYRRTPLQAFGWYLTFFLIGIVLAVLVSYPVFVVGVRTESERVLLMLGLVQQVTNVLYHVVLGAALLWNRPKNVINILLVLGGVVMAGAIGLSVVLDIAGGLIPFAALTTRSSNLSPEVIKVFE